MYICSKLRSTFLILLLFRSRIWRKYDCLTPLTHITLRLLGFVFIQSLLIDEVLILLSDKVLLYVQGGHGCSKQHKQATWNKQQQIRVNSRNVTLLRTRVVPFRFGTSRPYALNTTLGLINEHWRFIKPKVELDNFSEVKNLIVTFLYLLSIDNCVVIDTN
jgi:hypothetical protein